MVLLLLDFVAGDGIVVLEFFDGGLQNDEIFDFLAVVDDVGLVDEGVGIDEVELLLGEDVLLEIMAVMMFRTELESAGNIVSEVDFLYLVADPSLSGFL